ncbi:hypothetical protein CLIB1423_10S03004 [[Candida] railenensis]|uniref:Cyclin n=1 Tax=[Candida] railenensis TaxID=45579 RepID=A0A9P0QRK1_9ASCO|nr:hypothetical protein CLIB1423_10S03004 [[Candida] railenensis]
MSADFEVHLKPTNETFVDEPTSLQDVGIEELVFDLENNIKNINKLHVYHAMCIFKTNLEDIIKLQSNEELFRKYRRETFEKYDIDTSIEEVERRDSDCSNDESSELGSGSNCSSEEISSNKDDYNFGGIGGISSKITSMSTPPQRSDTSPDSSPLKFARLNDNFAEIPLLKETTPDSLEDSEIYPNEPVPEGPYVAIEELIKNSNIEDSLEQKISFKEELENELRYNNSKKIKSQNLHILKSFGLAKKPSLSIEEFLIRLQTYSPSISVSVYIHSAVMIYKLCILLNVVQLTELNVYRFILGSIRCSTKKLEDLYQKQKAFSTVGGVSQRDLFKIEVGFLYLTNFKIVVDEKRLQAFLEGSFLELRRFMKENS